MSRLNKPRFSDPVYTHEGGQASLHITPLQALQRSVNTCLLWEDTFYEDGRSIGDRIADLVPKVGQVDASLVAMEARKSGLRHVPLLVVDSMIKAGMGGKAVGDTLANVIQRADEIPEFLAIYWRNGRTPLDKQVKRGLSKAFHKFDEYQFAKYNRDNAIKMRDALRLVRPRPVDEQESALFERIKNGTLQTPDTWEVSLSGGKDKRETFERLLVEKKLGGLALIRNLRNMEEAGVSRVLVIRALAEMRVDRIFPYRFLVAARQCPAYARYLDEAMLRACASFEKLPGHTIILVDVSGSMDAPLSDRPAHQHRRAGWHTDSTQTTRMDAACGLAVLANEVCERATILSFSNRVAQIPAYRGIALVGAIESSMPHGSTYLRRACETIKEKYHEVDRFIVITDEQSHDGRPVAIGFQNYCINLAPYEHGVSYEPGWVNVSGWSEHVLRFIAGYEQLNLG